MALYPPTYTLFLAIRKRNVRALGGHRGAHDKIHSTLLKDLNDFIKILVSEFYSELNETAQQLIPCTHCLSSLLDPPLFGSEVGLPAFKNDLHVLLSIAALSDLNPPINFSKNCVDINLDVMDQDGILKEDQEGRRREGKESGDESVDEDEEDESVGDVHLFSYKDCRIASTNEKRPFVICPRGNVCVRLSLLAPDLTLSDIPLITNVVLKEKIGEGGFAIVYRGLLSLNDWIGESAPSIANPTTLSSASSSSAPSSSVEQLTSTTKNSQGPTVEVAVKILKSGQDFQILEDLLSEVYIMSLFKHPNILHMYGMCTRPSIGVVVEYVREKDLQKLLEPHTLCVITEDVPHPVLPVPLLPAGTSCIYLGPDGQSSSNSSSAIHFGDLSQTVTIKSDLCGTLSIPLSSLRITYTPLSDAEISWKLRLRITLDVAQGKI